VYVDEDPDEIVYFEEFVHGHFSLNIIKIDNDSSLDDVVDEILNLHPDAVVTDFLLNDKATVSFNGQALIDSLRERNKHLPCFLLTSHAPDALEATNDARIVQSKAVMTGERSDLGLLFRNQIARIIENHRAKLLRAEEELRSLLSLPGEQMTAQERKRVIELDDFIEEHGLGNHALPSEVKEERSIELLTELVHRVDELLKKSGRE
jgi:hypothetical protein